LFSSAAVFLSFGASYVLNKIAACNDDEKVLSLKRGNNLCESTGDWCAHEAKLLGKVVGCIQRNQGFCCYNAKLPKIINTSAHAQLGIGFGSPENADCSGLTMEQIAQVDFSKMDFTEFFDDIKASMPDPAAMSDKVQASIEDKLKNLQKYNSQFPPAPVPAP
jgi:conjugal transfer mating pair stabilization protein TraN